MINWILLVGSTTAYNHTLQEELCRKIGVLQCCEKAFHHHIHFSIHKSFQLIK